jgi:hypothetical protein
MLAAEARLPNLARLVEESGQVEALGEASATWTNSWKLSTEAAGAFRDQARLEAAHALADAVGPQVVAAQVQIVGEALKATAALEFRILDSFTAEHLVGARSDHAAALEAMADGRSGDALLLALSASDRIREVGPEGVARVLLTRAEEALNGAQGSGTRIANPEDTTRARRLIRGGHMALVEGDPIRALQRAFYAGQILRLDAPQP